MPSNIFENTVKNANASKEMQSQNWFRQRISMARMSPNRLLASDRSRLRKKPRLGEMYLFSYDPKTKDTLPYYDTYPLVIPFAPRENGFLGLNLHYLPPQLRARLLDGLYDYVNNERMDETTRFKLTYNLLQSASRVRFFVPCIKQYLVNHMQSQFFYIHPNEWDMATMLPLDRFVGAPKTTIYKDSRARIQT